MKNYTIHFLIITIFAISLGFSGLNFTGITAIRFIALISGIALMISCLDAVLISTRKRKSIKKQNNLQAKPIEVKSKNTIN